jgi:hypothetical protein
MLLSWKRWMSTSSRARVLGFLLAGSLALLAAMSFGAPVAGAETCALPGSNFQGGDGNQTTPTVAEDGLCNVALRPTTRDWQSDVAAGKVVTSTDPQANDSELTGKENAPNNWKLGAHAAGVKPPKDNIITAWSEVEPQAAGTFLYLAFQREGSVGTTFLTFELNQVKGEWKNEAGSTIPCRTTGDVLISYEVSGGSIGEVVVQEWTSTATTSVVIEGKSVNCGTAGELKGGAVKVEPAAGVQGAMNKEEIKNFLPDPANGTPATIETNNFGEAALNLVKVLKEAKINPCFDFGQIWMHTRSSLAVNSELHDYIAPVPLLVQSCSISGRKFDDANGNKIHDPNEAYLAGWKFKLLNATTKAVVQEATTDSEGKYTFTKVEPGTYIVEEVPQSGWTCDVPGEGKACQYEVTIDSEHLNVTEREFGNKPTSEVVTTQEPASGSVGSKFGDSATVSGPATGGAPTPTGIVEFRLYSDNHCGTLVEGPISETLSGGSASIEASKKVTLSTAGEYWWVATYGGDSYNASATSACNAEPITVEPAKPTIKTSATPSVTVGGKIKDVATLTGLVDAIGTEGSITFKLYSDEACTNEVFKSTATGISANTSYTSPGEYTTTATGTYYWRAFYSGDKNNEEASTPCKDANESSVVEPAKPTISTSPSGSVTVGEKVKDGATLKGLVDATGAGKVTFRLYSDEKCEHEVTSFESSAINGTGEVTVNSGEYVTTAAGTYYWTASYPGDANNQETKTKCGDETVVVNPAQPAISTKALTPVTVGGPIHDTATLTGLVDPTGNATVTFKAYSDSECKTTPLFESAPVFDANGEVSSADYTTAATGTVYWVATYSGDSNNLEAATKCGDTGESSLVEPAKPAISTNAVSPVTVGEPIHDTAKLEGLVDPTGIATVTFKAYSDDECKTAPLFESAPTFDANGEVPSADYTTATTGTVYWVATYSGDANNKPAATSCGDTGESSLVNPAQPAISTHAVTPVTVGEPIHDTAKLEGLVDPTGIATVTFKAYSDDECKTTPLFESAPTFDANGEVSSADYTTAGTGTVYWVATYSGDANNLEAATKCGDTGESSLVNPAQPAISTKAVSPVTVGGPIHDTATIEGLVDPVAGEGSITFKLFSDSGCKTEVSGAKSTVTGIGANGNYESEPFTPTSTGTYFWIATYSGDKNNLTATTKCEDAGETSKVTPVQPSISTKAVSPVTVGEKIKDTATLTGLVDPTGTGTVTFKLFSDEKCETGVFHSTSAGVTTNGNVESGAFTTTATGTYYWTASFSGDKNNEAAVSGCKAANESSLVNPAQPAISTHAVSPVTVGEPIHDTAKLEGLVDPTGIATVTFKAYSDSECKTTPLFESAPMFDANGEVSSADYTTTATGTVYWIATYSGDANNLEAATKCGDTGESSLVEPTKPSISTKAVSPVTVGAAIHDTATLSGLVNPTGEGTVTFKLYSDEKCETEVFKSTSAGVKANGNVESSEYTPTATGTYYWTASFSSDKNNEPAVSGCKAANESSLVEPAGPKIATQLASNPIPVDGSTNDSATLTEASANAGGTVDYRYYSSETECNTDATAFPGTAPAGGTDVGPVTVTSESVPNSAGATFHNAGTYYWAAFYSGDTNNAAAVSGCSTELLVVNKVQPGIITKAVSPVVVGAKIKDIATLSGLASPDGTGTVTFKLYSDSGCTTKVFESTNPASGGISANGDVPSSEFTTTAAGTYYWVATYSGDSNNMSAATKCEDANETSVVNKTKPGISTKATPLVTVGEKIKDTAKLTGLVNASTGTVTFKLFSDSGCTTEVAAAKSTSVAVTGSGTVEVPSAEFTTTAAGTYYWTAGYSGDSNNEPVSSGCKDVNESTVVEQAKPAISTTASAGVIFGGSLHDTAHLTGGFDPTGKITFTLYAAGDTSCTTALKTVETEVNKGNGDYESPSVTPSVGSYQWVASYSGDANNSAATTSCNDPNEQASVGQHPGISEVKEQQVAGSGAPFTTAPLNATVGQQINYRITVTNTGDVPLTLSFSDPHCDAGTITGPTGNLNPDGTLPPGGVVQYFCSHVLKEGDAPQLVNAATVTGQPPSGPPVSATSSVTTNVAKQVVAAVCSVSEGTIALHGASGSKRGPFTVRISALGIKQITFYLDKRKLKTLTSAQAKNGQFTIKIDPRKLRFGAHTVSVKTVMSDANCANLARAGVFVHPRPPVVKPKFTG